VPTARVLRELRAVLAQMPPSELDWITFAGSGEPTLHSGLGLMIREAKALGATPVAVLTSGALLYRADVREDLQAADAVLPSLDAGTPELYKAINRPWPELTFERHVAGLAQFRREYSGRLWIEVMLLRNVNDGERELRDLAAVLERIGPDEVHLNVPIRPPAEPWVEIPDPAALARAREILGASARVVTPAEGAFELPERGAIGDDVLDVISRHPVREEELVWAIERRAPGRAAAVLDELEKGGRASVIVRHGRRYWCDAASRFAGRSLPPRPSGSEVRS
jgi:wyosine [tRNA(Phe)-imidazoG37] synthetase (radical SAM superfamily)